MEKTDVSSFDVSDVQIEDGFEYGDWRDECMSDKLNEECFNPRISLLNNQFDKGRLPQTSISIF